MSACSGATYELGHEGNHEIEETDGLDEGEAENGVREELATESGVAGDTVEEGSEDETDTDTGAGQTDGGGTHAEVLGSLNHGLGDLRRVGAAGLEAESLAGGGIEDGGRLLALEGLEGSGWSGNSRSDSARRARSHTHDYGGFHALDIPEKVRLPALATWTRRAGRATLVEAEAICEARREARTRVEAIVSGWGEGVVVDGRWARKWLTQKNTGGESLRLLVGGRKREEGRGGSEKDQGSWPWWNGSSGWSGQRLAGGQRTMSLANWSPRRHFYCGCSTGAGGIWWVGHPRGALDTQQGKILQWHWEWAEGREEDLVHRSRAGFRGENTLIGQCRKGGFGVPVSSSSARRFYISRSGACLASCFPPQLTPSQWMMRSFEATPLFPPPSGTPASWVKRFVQKRAPRRKREELRQFAVCHENFHMALICEAMRLHPPAGVYVIAAPTGPHFAAEQPSRFAQALARPMEPRQEHDASMRKMPLMKKDAGPVFSRDLLSRVRC